MKYITLNEEVIDLSTLSDNEKEIYEEAKRFAQQGPHWTEFSNFFIEKVHELNASVDSTIYKLLQDIDSRLGIRQGLTRLKDGKEGKEVALTGEE